MAPIPPSRTDQQPSQAQTVFWQQQQCKLRVTLVYGEKGVKIPFTCSRRYQVGQVPTLFALLKELVKDPDMLESLKKTYRELTFPDDLEQVVVKVCRPGDKKYDTTKHDFQYWYIRKLDKDIWEDKRRLLCPDAQRMEEGRLIPLIDVYINADKIQAVVDRVQADNPWKLELFNLYNVDLDSPSGDEQANSA